MQLRAVFAAALAILAATPAQALCGVVLDTGGTLALSGDATVLGSDAGLGGAPATVLITSVLEDNTIDVSAPARITAPAGYDPSGEAVEVAYAGVGLLAGVTQGYTGTASSFTIGPLGTAMTLLVHNRIVNMSGFAPGSYTTRTVITCH